MSEDQEIYFKRFDTHKQYQIRQLVSYVTLLGLSADDLVSIGNRLKRIKISEESKLNKALVKDLYNQVSIDGYRYHNLVFTLKYNDKVYKFKFNSWYSCMVEVENTTNKIKKNFNLKPYNAGGGISGRVQMALVNIKNGDIVLDF